MLKSIKYVCLLFIFFVNGFCQKSSTGWWILRRPQSTKPKSVTAVAAVRGDLSGVFYNPAITGVTSQKEIFLMNELGLANDVFGGILYGHPFKNSSSLIAGLIYYNAGRTTLYYYEKGRLLSREVDLQKDFLTILSYGRKIKDKFSFGVSAKLVNSNIAEVADATAIAVDFGTILFSNINGLSISFAIQNLGFSNEFLDKTDDLPTSLWAGINYSKVIFKHSYFCFGIEMPYILKENRTLASLGIEYVYKEFGINFGYIFGLEDATFHLGFGFGVGKFDIGYSFIPTKYLSSIHRISVGIRF